MSWIIVLALSLAAWGKTPSLSPTLDEFRRLCQEHRQDAAGFRLEPPEIGEETYFPTIALDAAQNRFAFQRFLGSLKKAVKEEPDWFAHDRGRALYGMHKRIKAVFYRGRLFIVDGHHRALISTYLGAKTIPVKILDDLSHLSPAKFRETMERRGWAYWRNYRGAAMTPVDLCDLADDPYLHYVRLVIVRLEAKIENGHLYISNVRGADPAIAIKINSDVPHFENMMADAIHRSVDVDPDFKGKSLPEDVLEEALDALWEKAQRKSSPLRKVLLLDKPKRMAKLKLEKLILEHLEQADCEDKLRADDDSD